MALTRQEIGARLRAIREEIGFTQAEVAKRLQVHRPTISEIEAGRRAVSSEELFKLAAIYAHSVADFLLEARPTEEMVLDVMFRAGGDPGRPETRIAVQRFMNRCREERGLEDLLELSRPVDARPSYRTEPPRNKGEAIRQGEQVADQERNRLDLGALPVSGLPSLLEKQGVCIGPIIPEDGAQIDGFYFESDSLGACIAINPNNGEGSSFRDVFTAAHEYAHWLLKDRPVELLDLSVKTDDLLEVRANAFAAAFLLPRNGLVEYFSNAGMLREGALSHLSQGDVVRAMDQFGVSRQALLYRMQNLGLISEPVRNALWHFSIAETAKALEITFGGRGFIGTRLPMLAVHAWRQGLVSTARAASLCEKSVEEYRTFVQEIGEEQNPVTAAPLIGAAAG